MASTDQLGMSVNIMVSTSFSTYHCWLSFHIVWTRLCTLFINRVCRPTLGINLDASTLPLVTTTVCSQSGMSMEMTGSMYLGMSSPADVFPWRLDRVLEWPRLWDDDDDDDAAADWSVRPAHNRLFTNNNNNTNQHSIRSITREW